MTSRIDLADLRLGKQLARGGQGQIFPVLQRTDAWNRPLIYKAYLPELAARLDVGVLDELGDLPRRHPESADWLRDHTAWPQILVEQKGRVVGFLMQAIPPDYRFDFQTAPQQTMAKVCEYAFLLNSDQYLQSSGLALTDQDRLLLLAGVAAGLDRFHRMGVAVGDLSPKNLLFSPDRSHRSFFIDCDAMSVVGASVLKQAHTPDWKLPAEDERAGTAAADDFKFGLLAIRLFARNQSAHDPAAISAISAELGDLARRSQQSDPMARPAAADWLNALHAAASRPELAVSRPLPPDPSQTQTIQTPYPAPAGYPVPAVSPQRTRNPLARALVGAVVLLGLVGAGIGVNNALSHNGDQTTAGSVSSGVTYPTDVVGSDSPDPAQSDSPSPSPSPIPVSSVGMVSIDTPVAEDPRAQQVAALFDTYFSAISEKNYARVLRQYDPAGSVNPNDPQQVKSFEKGISTSSDSNVALEGLSPNAPDPATTAEITFESTQAAGYGPSGARDQTCTQWTLTYQLTYSDAAGYRILTSKGSFTGC